MFNKAFFKPEITKQEGFKEGKLNDGGFKGEINGIVLYRQSHGEMYCSFDNLESKLPESLLKYVTRVETLEHITARPHRERGLYRLGKAIGELDITINNKDIYSLSVKGSTIESIKVLYEAIRVGTIRPYKSYEKEQCSPKSLTIVLEQIKQALYRVYFWPWGFWKNVRDIVRKAESEMLA